MSSNYDSPTFKVAAVQSAAVYKEPPQYFDTEATLEKAIGFIEEAGGNGARLVVFPECFLPGYPYFGVDHTNERSFGEVWGRFLQSSVEVPSRETEALCAAAKKANTYIAMGLNERDKKYTGRMYNSILYVSPQGKVLGTHRKICNTLQERLYHTPGDGGDNLKTVFDTGIGRLGGSICGEHCQFTLLHYWIMQGVQVHCSLWPGIKAIEAHIDVNTRAMCFTGHCFAVLSSGYLPQKDWPASFYSNSMFNGKMGLHGGSGIVNPNGEYITGPVYDEETIVYGDVDLGKIDQSLFAVNPTGAYSRWDILNVNVREESYEPIVPMADAKEPKNKGDLEERLAQLEKQVAALSRKMDAADEK